MPFKAICYVSPPTFQFFLLSLNLCPNESSVLSVSVYTEHNHVLPFHTNLFSLLCLNSNVFQHQVKTNFIHDSLHDQQGVHPSPLRQLDWASNITFLPSYNFRFSNRLFLKGNKWNLPWFVFLTTSSPKHGLLKKIHRATDANSHLSWSVCWHVRLLLNFRNVHFLLFTYTSHLLIILAFVSIMPSHLDYNLLEGRDNVVWGSSSLESTK